VNFINRLVLKSALAVSMFASAAQAQECPKLDKVLLNNDNVATVVSPVGGYRWNLRLEDGTTFDISRDFFSPEVLRYRRIYKGDTVVLNENGVRGKVVAIFLNERGLIDSGASTFVIGLERVSLVRSNSLVDPACER